MRAEYSLNSIDEAVHSIKNDFPGIPVREDPELRMYADLVEKVRSGEKRVTIRYAPGKIRVPRGPAGTWNLPLIQTYPDSDERSAAGIVRIGGLLVAHLADFTDGDAHADLFRDKRDMVDGIESIYKVVLQPDDVLSMYRITNYFPSQ